MRDIAAQTHPGKTRGHNEDAIVVVPEHGICVVADGVGGHQRGEVASRMVCDSVRDGLLQGQPLIEVIQQAHQQVLHCIEETAQGQPTQNGMGSTVVAIKLTDDHTFELAWVGDSRAYLWDGALTQLSRDHSVVEELLASQVITPEQAHDHPDRNVITQSLGVSAQMQLDIGHVSGQLEPESELLLCSDGLTNELSDAEISQLLQSAVDPQDQLDALMARVLETAARDNVSVVVVGRSQATVEADASLGRWLNGLTFVLAIAAFAYVVSRFL